MNARVLARRVWWRLPLPVRDRLRLLLRPAPKPWRPPDGGTRPRIAAAASDTHAGAVSVVIPTLDAGPDFARVLAALRRQRGIDLELLVLDSGSRDGSVELARRAGASVVDVAPGTFGHGRTRQDGAARATAPVIAMLAQDAVPIGEWALRDLALQLDADERLAAVSARQIPRSDADLYASYVVLAHDRVLDASPGSRRSAAALDDVCAAYRRAAWEQIGFADVPFAEDLDFGLRAVDAGWRVSRTADVAVAHSHNRDALYALRRSAVDRLTVAEQLGDRDYVRAASAAPRAVLASAAQLVGEVSTAVASLPPDPTPLGTALAAVRSSLRKKPAPADAEGELAAVERFLATVGEGVPEVAGYLRDDLVSVLGWPVLTDFAGAHTAVAHDETAAFVARVACAVIGRAAGDSLRRAPDDALAAALTGGV